jgi:hypothetical protein
MHIWIIKEKWKKKKECVMNSHLADNTLIVITTKKLSMNSETRW